MRRILVCLLLLAGCLDEHGSDGSDVPPQPVHAPLSDFHHLGVRLLLLGPTESGERTIEITLTYDHPFPSCRATNPDMIMEVAGVAAMKWRSGHYERMQGSDGLDYFCIEPTFLVNLPADLTGASTVRIADASLDLTFAVTLP